jgi:hypothetical protein
MSKKKYFNKDVHTFSMLIIVFICEERRRFGVGLVLSVSNCISLDIPDDEKSKRTSNESKSFFVVDLTFKVDGEVSSDG